MGIFVAKIFVELGNKMLFCQTIFRLTNTKNTITTFVMLQETNVKTIDKVVIRFAGDSGDGMQLAGNIFSNISAGEGNQISTFPGLSGRDPRAPGFAERSVGLSGECG